MNSGTVPTFSFVIPALNEEREIGRTIDDIRAAFPDRSTQFEIIVVDNGSTDKTVQVVQGMGVVCYIDRSMNISQLRNLGAEKSLGSILVFIDADVSLAPDWKNNIWPLQQRLLSNEKLVCGSHQSPDPTDNKFLCNWYQGIYENPSENFLPSGHTIVSRYSFADIGEYSPSFLTGEDVDFCQRAIGKSYRVEHHPEIGAIHRGNPQTIWQYMKRECWHSGADFRSIKRILQSRPAIATVLFIVAHVSLLVAILADQLLLFAGSLFAIGSLLISTSFYLFRKSPIRRRLLNTAIAYFYYLGRSGSVTNLFHRR